jgi:hypothetical protein
LGLLVVLPQNDGDGPHALVQEREIGANLLHAPDHVEVGGVHGATFQQFARSAGSPRHSAASTTSPLWDV